MNYDDLKTDELVEIIVTKIGVPKVSISAPGTSEKSSRVLTKIYVFAFLGLL